MLGEYRRRRDYTVQALNDIPGVRCAMPGGAFYAYPNIGSFLGENGLGSGLDFVTGLLKEAHVAVVPGEAFGTTEHFSAVLRHFDARARTRHRANPRVRQR